MARNGPAEALAEAVERRARMQRAWGAQTQWQVVTTAGVRMLPNIRYLQFGERWPGVSCRRWACPECVTGCTCAGPCECDTSCGNNAPSPEDVGLIDGVPVAMCADCRAHHASPSPSGSSSGDDCEP